MSVCQSGQTEEDSGSEEVTATAAAVRDIYKQRPASKVVRVMTVLAYLLSVSLAAILLSVYYVCVWKSPELPALNDTGGRVSAQRTSGQPHEYMSSGLTHNFTGGSDSGVNTLEDPAPPNITNVFNGIVTDTTTDLALNESTSDTTLLSDPLNSSYDGGTNDTDIT